MSTSTKSILEALYKTQCIDMEETLGLSQKLLETDMMLSDKNIQEQKTSVNALDAPNIELQIAEPSGEGITVQGSSDEVKNFESSKMEVNDASHVKLGSEPYVGLQFGSQEEAYEFYNAYAKEKGFSIRKSRIERSRIDHSMISRLFVCTNQGLRSSKDKRYEGKIVRPRQETRLDCRAAMFIKKRSGKWHVERFHKEHNHDLVDPAKAEKLRSHRKMTMMTKTMIEELYKCGVGPSKIVELLTGLADGTKDNIEDNGAVDNNESKNLFGSPEADCDCTMKKERKNNIRAECYQLLDCFQEMQVVDPGFFYAVEFSENRCMRSICWVDGKSREAYKKYGDVLVFDMICRTNKYLFPFACFTGLNHHRQPVLFGCAFLADETAESLAWLFETWLRAMSNQQPNSIITNQDKAMKVAIEKVFPETRHRFCMWNIEKDGLENLTHLYDMHPDFEADYKRCIFSSWTSKEFESGWEAILLKYNLKDNKWLNKLYNQRHHWVPLYLQDAFFGGMTTTHKTEGMHSYFDGFLHGGMPFSDFIPKYEQAVKTRREQEANEDFVTVCTRAALASKNPIEEQAAKVYTKNMFTIFQREFLESSGCTARKVEEEGPLSQYLVGKYRDKDDNMRIVTFNPSDTSASCSCQMFESEGMLCRHVLKVFQVMDVFEIPPHCILKRWTMSDRYIDTSSDDVSVSSHDVNAINTWTLKDKLKQFVELGETSNERISIAINILQEGMKKISLIAAPTVVMPAENLGCNSSRGEGVDEQSANIWTMDLNITAPDPHRVKLNGRPVSPGMKLGMDQGSKKKRTCGTCKETGHYTRTCPNAPADYSQSPALLQGIVGQSLTTATLQGGLIHTQTSGILPGSINQSQTSIMLQEPFGQGLDTSPRVDGDF
ncbi:hypothetical protein Syun_003161 [Stephania yunnanensis]|uniref:Protein FAR1-RELATED SEQUENCE n=1 Tax=Stephania yunnanensis TaxID=152371 RepID=A0AAP0L2R6_9MAGN